MTTTRRARDAASRIWEAWTSGQRVADLPAAVRPCDLAEAMTAQAALTDLAGPRFGWKIAATSEPGQTHLGVSSPLAGAMYERFRHTDGATVSLFGCSMRVAEPEFAFQIGVDVDDDQPTEEQVSTAVAAMHLALELPGSRYQDIGQVDGPQVVADGACSGSFVLGPSVDGWSALDLATQLVTLEVDDDPVARGSGAQVLGDPRHALHWLACELPRHGLHLRAGDIVTTGTAAPPAAVAPGGTVAADFTGLGRVCASLSE